MYVQILNDEYYPSSDTFFPDDILFRHIDTQEIVADKNEFLRDLGFYPLDDNIPNDFDDLKENLILKHRMFWEYDDTSKSIKKTYDRQIIPFDETKQRAKDKVTAERYDIEHKGIYVNGNFILTDRHSRTAISSCFLMMKKQYTNVIYWKNGSNWYMIFEPELVFISNCVFDYINKCFLKEKDLYEQIDNLSDGDYTSLHNIINNIVWPNQYYTN